MTALIIVVGYPVFMGLLILLDRCTGYQLAEAFGKDQR